MTDLAECVRSFAGHGARWRPGAIYPEELAWLVWHFREMGCTTLIECGRQDGVSTEILAESLPKSRIVSIDLDADPARAAAAEQRLARHRNVELLTGNVHRVVPQLLQAHPDERIAVVQDAAKGWEGLGTLLAAALFDNVALVAQHNLHEGHQTRDLFLALAAAPCFLEQAPDAPPEAMALRPRESNRPTDHTSLGVLRMEPEQRRAVLFSCATMARSYGPWNPCRIRAAWLRGELDAVERITSRARFTWARFKRR